MEKSENGPARSRGRPRSWYDKSDQNVIKSLDRALEILEFVSSGRGQTLTGISAALGQSPATVYRVLVTLEKRGLTEFDPVAQHWHLGASAYVIGARFLRRSGLAERARPILTRLMERTGETANLGMLQGTSVLFVGQAETSAAIRAFFPPGTLSPLHASGIGKALLAESDPDLLTGMIEHMNMERFTDTTICEPKTMLAELAEIRARGYAIDAEERHAGMRCIAAAVHDAEGRAVAGISVSGPAIRMTEDSEDQIAQAVIEAAGDLSRAIGGSRDSP